MGRTSCIIQWVQYNKVSYQREAKSFRKGCDDRSRSWRVRENLEVSMLLALKMGEGAMSQGMQLYLRNFVYCVRSFRVLIKCFTLPGCHAV